MHSTSGQYVSSMSRAGRAALILCCADALQHDTSQFFASSRGEKLVRVPERTPWSDGLEILNCTCVGIFPVAPLA